MKMFKCDICEKEVNQYDLYELKIYYQTNKIKEVCKDCLDTINNADRKCDEALNAVKKSWIHQIIKRLLKERG